MIVIPFDCHTHPQREILVVMSVREVAAVRLKDVIAPSSSSAKWDCLLGESPTYDKRTRLLYWVDILRIAVLRVYLPRKTDLDTPSYLDAPKPAIEMLCLPNQPFLSVGFVALVQHRPNDLIVGTQDGLYLLCNPSWCPYDEATAGTTGCVDLSTCEKLSAFPGSPFNPSPTHPLRFNDGKVSPQGNIVAGVVQCKMTQTFTREHNSGALFILTACEGGDPSHQHCFDAAVVSAVGGVTVSNGMDWADATSTTVVGEPLISAFYYIDTACSDVKRFKWSHDTGRIDEVNNKCGGETIWRVSSSAGLPKPSTSRPDGMCIDTEGCLWVAFWGGNSLARLRPPSPLDDSAEWRIDVVVTFPSVVANVSSCCFGPAVGGDTDDCCCLYVTTAKGSTIDEAAGSSVGEDDVRSGEVFVVDLSALGISGKPSNLARL